MPRGVNDQNGQMQMEKEPEVIKVSHDDLNVQLQRNAFRLDPPQAPGAEEPGGQPAQEDHLLRDQKNEKDWVKENLASFVKKKEQKIAADKKNFDIRHNVTNHSKRFFSVIDESRRQLGNSREIYYLTHIPDQSTLGKEFEASFSERISAEKRAEKKQNKRSRLYQKEKNAQLLEKSLQEHETATFDALNRALTRQALRCEAQDYHDLAMFMKENDETANRELVNLYLGKSLRQGPGGLEGQDVQLALDRMAGQLFGVDVRNLRFDNDTEMAKNAPELERIAGQVAAFDRLAQKHHFMESLNEEERTRLTERLEALRSLSAYYQIRKEIITNQYYRDHYNSELSLDLVGAASEEQRELSQKLLQSQILGRSMMQKNGVDLDAIRYNGEHVRFRKEDTRQMIKDMNRQYSKADEQKKLVGNAHLKKDARAEKELARLKKRIMQLDRESPIQEQKNIQAQMDAVQDRAFMPVEYPENSIGFWSMAKNRLMVGFRWFSQVTLGTLSRLLVAPTLMVASSLAEKGVQETAQKERRHDMVPGREGEFFREEIVRKDEKGEDIDIYSDVRRGPLVWEKLTAGDPEEPPEVTIMVQQARRGSSSALVGKEMGHAMIGLSYSRYNKTTGRKERYRLTMGFYPGGGLVNQSMVAMLGGVITGGRLDSDNNHNYDIARRYQVKPGDINKILREAEKYADKGYGYFKRNCSTFVVDMAKSIGLDVANEFKEDEMVFEGNRSVLVEGGTSLQGTGYYHGKYALASKMNKMDLTYQNFGQKMYTQEDLDRYKETGGTGDLVKKGYSPGAIGETLRQSKSGELTAFFQEDEKLKVQEISAAITDAGDALWEQILAIVPREQLQEAYDTNAMMDLSFVGDGGLGKLMKKERGFSPKDVRKVHKNIRDAMKAVNKYYRERLGSDARLNPYLMKYLSLCEAALTYADRAYQLVLFKDAQGDAGRLRYDYSYKDCQISYTDGQKRRIETKMSPGLYEGYLMAGLTPDQAVKNHLRYLELEKIPREERTAEQKKEHSRLDRYNTLAASFSSANRYLLEKEEFDDKDLHYAFSELPKKEREVKEGRVRGTLIDHHRPSLAYQGVVFEKMFGGFKALKLQECTSLAEQAEKLDNYLMTGIAANSEMARRIIKHYIDGKNQSEEELSTSFLSDLCGSCLEPAYADDEIISENELNAITMTLAEISQVKTWLLNEIQIIRSGGGV